MTLSPEALYMHLGQLITEMPDFASSHVVTPEKQKWLGTAVALVELQHDFADIAELKRAARYTRWENADTRLHMYT